MKLFRHVSQLFLLTGLALFMIPACRDVSEPVLRPSAHDYNSDVIVRWNELFMDIDRYAKGYRPTPAPRALAYAGLAAYESVVAGIPENQSLKYGLPGLSTPDAEQGVDYFWPACANEAYAYMMTRFFFHMENDYAALFARIEQTRKNMHDEFAGQTTTEILERSEAYGRAVAAAVYAYETSDAIGHNAFLEPQPLSYTPPQGPGRWQPTFPDYSRAMYPQWGKVRTFALGDGELLARPPIPYSELEGSLFYNQAIEVYNSVNQIRNYPADPQAYDQFWMGEFWSDDILGWTFSPASRLVAIANQVVTIENTDLAGSVELYTKLGMAMSDAGVSLWKSKFHYNLERPVSYIRRVLGSKYADAATWTPLLRNPTAGLDNFTPPFPAYPSGHSGFGGAGGKILSSFFEFTPEHPGTYSFTDNCHINRVGEFLGYPRSFSSFKEMADEDAYSRIPLGVHFRIDCSEGLRIGELAAQRVLELPWKK